MLSCYYSIVVEHIALSNLFQKTDKVKRNRFAHVCKSDTVLETNIRQFTLGACR